MKKVKRIICTSIAALTVISSSVAFSNYSKGESYGNYITADAANVKGRVVYCDDITSVNYGNYLYANGKYSATFYYKNNKYTSYYVTYIKNTSWDGDANSIIDALKDEEEKYDLDTRAKLAYYNGLAKSKKEYKNNSSVRAAANESMVTLIKQGHLIKTRTKYAEGAVH